MSHIIMCKQHTLTTATDSHTCAPPDNSPYILASYRHATSIDACTRSCQLCARRGPSGRKRSPALIARLLRCHPDRRRLRARHRRQSRRRITRMARLSAMSSVHLSERSVRIMDPLESMCMTGQAPQPQLFLMSLRSTPFHVPHLRLHEPRDNLYSVSTSGAALSQTKSAFPSKCIEAPICRC